MQIVSIGDNLHDMSKPVFRRIKTISFNISSVENLTQSAKREADSHT